MMNHTLRDVANNADVSKVAVFQHFKRIRSKLGNHTRKHKNRILLDDKAYYRLLDSFKHINKQSNNSNANLTIIKILKSALKDKSNRINSLNRQNVKLNESLKHQQELQLGEQRTNAVLINKLSRSLSYSNKKHGFWWKITHIFG